MLPQFIVFLSGDFKKDKKHHDRFAVYDFISNNLDCTRDELCISLGFTTFYVNAITEYLSRNEIVDFSGRITINGKISHTHKVLLKELVLDTSCIINCSGCGFLVTKSRNSLRKDLCTSCTKQQFQTAQQSKCQFCDKTLNKKSLRRYKKQDCCVACLNTFIS